MTRYFASLAATVLVAFSATALQSAVPSLTSSAQAQTIKSGSLSGRSGHKVSGSVRIIKTASGYTVKLGSNFKHDSAPGPYLAFGRNGAYVASTQFSKLRKNRGAQTYKLPARIDPTKFNTFVIWCKPFKVPLAVARLN